jgi:hypothetical protein
MALKVEPTKIVFDSVQPGCLYVMTISVRNVGLIAQRIRLQAPKSSIFALNYIPSGVVSPGLDIRAELECLIPPELTDHVFRDKVIAQMGDEIVEIPIIATKPSLKLEYDRKIDLGYISSGHTFHKEICIHNYGAVPGSLKLSLNKGSVLKFNSSKLDFQPFGTKGDKAYLKFSFELKDPGIFRDFIRLIDLATQEVQEIEILAQIVKPSLSILTMDKKGILEVASFGNIYFGEQRVISALLVNSGPIPLSFSLRFEDEEESNNQPSSDSGEQTSKPLSITPSDGIVKPFSEVLLTISFIPHFQSPEKGFMLEHRKEISELKLFRRLAVLECLDSMQNITVALEGGAVSPLMQISPSMLRFGECSVNDRRDILVSLKNPNSLPIHFEFPVAANFKFNPTKGKILPNETTSVIASFLPPQLGTFKTSVNLSLAKGLKYIDIKLVGEANALGGKKTLVGGTDKLPQDFAVEHKFVNPEEEAAARVEKRKLKEEKLASTMAQARTARQEIQSKVTLEEIPAPPIIDASSEVDDVYGTNPIVAVDVDPKETYKHQMLDFYRKHNAHYNQFLTQSRNKREFENSLRKKTKLLNRGAVDLSDPFGVNMGMERGLEEPILHIPPATEPLIMAGGPSDGGTGAKRLPVDENRLIQKKYGSTPVTQAQFRDCTCELNSEELKLVTASHKVRFLLFII